MTSGRHANEQRNSGVLRLRKLGRSMDDIAGMLKLTRGQVAGIIHRAKESGVLDELSNGEMFRRLSLGATVRWNNYYRKRRLAA